MFLGEKKERTLVRGLGAKGADGGSGEGSRDWECEEDKSRRDGRRRGWRNEVRSPKRGRAPIRSSHMRSPLPSRTTVQNETSSSSSSEFLQMHSQITPGRRVGILTHLPIIHDLPTTSTIHHASMKGHKLPSVYMHCEVSKQNIRGTEECKQEGKKERTKRADRAVVGRDCGELSVVHLNVFK